MPSDVLITPASSKIDFTDGANSTKRLSISGTAFSFNSNLNVLSSTSLGSAFKAEGVNGTLFEVTDDLSNSLMSVNTIGGLPVFEVFANNTIIAGQYNANDLVITGNKVGIGLASPTTKLHILAADATTADLARFQQTNQGNLLIQSQQGSQNIGGSNGILFSNATGVIGFRTNTSSGDAQVLLNASGNLGIGTVSATSKLTVVQSSGADSVLLELQSNNDPGIRFGRSTYGSLIRHVSAAIDYIAFNSSGSSQPSISATAQVVFDENGNVGVGTVTPLNKIHIAGSASIGSSYNLAAPANGLIVQGNVGIGTSSPAATGLEIVNSASPQQIIRTTSSTGYSSLRLYNDQNSSGRALEIDYSGSAYSSSLLTNGPTGESACITTTGAYPLVLGTNNTARLAIISNGNIGIGIINPSQRLDVRYDDGVTNGEHNVIASFSRNGTNSLVLGYRANGTNVTSALIRTADNTPLTFGTSSTTQAIVLLDNGNVGIGATTPSQKLEVQGNIKLGADNSGNYIYYVTDIERTIINTSRSDATQAGLFRSDGWGNFTVDKSIGVGYSLGSGFSSSTIGNGNLFVAGKIGIGTTNPSAKLSTGSSSGMKVLVYDNPSTGVYTGLGQDLAAGNSTDLFAHSLSNLGFITFGKIGTNGSTYTEWARFNTSGNLGIGITSPAYKLDVNGSTRLGGIVFNEAIKIDDFNYFNLQPYIESETLSSILSISGTAPAFVTLTNTTAPFSKVMSVSAYGEAFLGDYIPVQPGETIYGEIWTYRATGAAGTAGVLYCGVMRYDKDKKMIDANGGLNTAPSGYFIASNQTIPSNSTWTKYSGTLVLPTSHTPYSTSDGGPVRYIRPYIIYNYTAGTILTYIGGWKIRKTELTRDSGPVAINGSVAIGSSSVNYGRLQISASTTTPSLSSANPTDVSLIISNSDVAYGTMFAAYGDGKGALQQRRTNTATYYDFSLQPHGGNVGIGITTPSAKLSLNKGAKSQFLALDIANNDQKYAIYVDQDNTDSSSFSIWDTTNSHTAIRYLPSSSGYWQLYTNNIERVRIDNSGNVGISTITPTAKVESYFSSNSVTFNYLATNLNVNSPVSTYSFDVTNGSTESRSIKAGIGYERHLTNGRGTMHFYNRTTDDAVNFGGTRTTPADIKMSLDNSGNLGIGTATPSAKLDVAGVIRGDAGANNPHSFTNTDSGNTHWINRLDRLLTSNGANWATDGRDPIMALVTSGNSNTLTIANSIGLALHNESTTDNTFSPAIVFSNRSNSTSYNTAYAAIIGRKTGQGIDSNWSAGELHFYTMPVGAYINNIPAMLINSAGNVGIGTTSTSGKLIVFGTANTIELKQSATGSATYYVMDNTVETGGKRYRFGYSGASSDKGSFTIYNQTDNITPFTILTNGNVGIGSNAPNNKLHINGSTSIGSGYNTAGPTNSLIVEGNFGAGTTSPDLKVHIDAVNAYPASSGTTPNGYLILRAKTAGGTHGMYLGVGNASPYGSWIQCSDSGNLATNYPLLLNPNGGSVGIGLTNPSYKLDVGAAGSGVISVRLTPGTERVRYNGFDLLGYNDGNLWMMGNNPTNTLLLSNNWDWDYQIAISYTPSTIGAAGGSLEIGQMTKNNANFTHGNTRFYTNGIERLRIINNGNVGIGISSPAARLHVNSTTSGATLLRADGTNGTLFSVVDDLSDSLMSVNNSAGLPVLEVFADDRVVAGQYGANDFVLVNNKLGLGTNNPNKQLTFAQTNDDAIQIRRITVGSGGPAAGTGISWTWTSATTDTETWAAIRAIFPGSGDTHLTFSNRPANGSTTERMRIQNTGNIGIGIQSPNATLHLKPIAVGANGFILERNASTAKLVYMYEYAADGYIEVRNGSDVIVSKISGYASTPTYFQSNVGIGTTTPATLLHIGTGTPTASGNGIQFGDDAGARIYRGGSSYIQTSAGFASGAYVYATTYLQTGNNLIYPNGYSATQRLEVGNAANNAWIDGLTIAPGGNVVIAGYLNAGGQTLNGQSFYQWEGATYRNPGDHTPQLLITETNSSTGINGFAPALALYNNNGGDQTTVGMVFVSAEAVSPTQGNAVNLAGIIAKKESAGTAGGWSRGSLNFFVKNFGTKVDALTIQYTGNVGIGTTAPAALLQIGAASPTAATSGIQFGDDTTARLYRSASATIYVSNNLTVGATLTESSSIRYKENIKTISAPILPKLNEIRPVTYNKKDNPNNTEYGLIAEELYEIFPEFVNKNDNGEIESVNYSRLTVLLLKAIKELKEEVEILKNK